MQNVVYNTAERSISNQDIQYIEKLNKKMHGMNSQQV